MKNQEIHRVGAGIIFIMIGAMIMSATSYLYIASPGGDVGLGIAIGAITIALGAGIVLGARDSRREG